MCRINETSSVDVGPIEHHRNDFVSINTVPTSDHEGMVYWLSIMKGCCTVKPVTSGPTDEGTPADIGHFCLARIGFQFVNALWSGDTFQTQTGDWQIMKFSFRYLAWGDSLQTEHPLNINFYSQSADLIDLAWNWLCLAARMVEAEPEAVHEH